MFWMLIWVGGEVGKAKVLYQARTAAKSHRRRLFLPPSPASRR